MIFVAFLALVALPQDPVLLPAKRIEAEGKPIDVTVGHAAPFSRIGMVMVLRIFSWASLVT